MALSISEGEIQFPRAPVTPSRGSGMLSFFSGVEMKVLLSTLATSAGSVLDNQLETNITF